MVIGKWSILLLSCSRGRWTIEQPAARLILSFGPSIFLSSLHTWEVRGIEGRQGNRNRQGHFTWDWDELDHHGTYHNVL